MALSKEQRQQVRKINNNLIAGNVKVCKLTASEVALLLLGYKQAVIKFCTEKTRLAVYARQADLCIYCGCKLIPGNGKASIDHFIPKCEVKTLTMFCVYSLPSNLLGACKDCNNLKGSLSLSDWYQKALTLNKVRSIDGQLETLNNWEERIKMILDCPLVGFTQIPLMKILKVNQKATNQR